MSRITMIALVVGSTAAVAQTEPPLAHYYGFLPAEIYKLDQRIQNCLVADVNGDGLDDVAIVNNLKNRIDVLQQRKSGKPEQEAPAEVNDVVSSGRMLHRKIPMQRPVAGLAVRDVNADGRPDLIYLSADPSSVNIELQDADGNFGDRRSVEIEDIVAREWTMDVGDVNGDGRPDIVFLSKDTMFVVTVSPTGTLSEPKRYRISGTDPGLLKIVDVDEDGRQDVVFITQDPQFPVHLRLQNKQGRLGPEHQIELERPRSVTWGKIDAERPGANMLTVSDLTGRLTVHRLSEAKARPGVPAMRFLTFPFEKTGSSSNTDLTVADIDGDGKLDVVGTDAGGARVVVYRQADGEGLDLGAPYPTPLGTSSARTLKLGDKTHLLTLSTTEKSISIASWDQNRLSFPQPLPTKDEPVAVEVAGEGNDARVVYVARVENQATFTEKFMLRALKPSGQGGNAGWTPANVSGDKAELDLNLTTRPAGLKAVDADGDGKEDLLVFSGTDEAPTLWLGTGGGVFTATPKSAQGSLGNLTPAAVFYGKLDGDKPSLLVSQGNYVRKMKYETEGRWKVVDQFNAPSAAAKVAGTAGFDVDGDGANELVMYDRNGQLLEFLTQKNGRWERSFQRKIGAFNLKGVHVGDFNGDGRADLLVYDNDKMGVLFPGRNDLTMETIASYETPNTRARLMDSAVGDLNGDGRTDVLAMDAQMHTLEVLAVQTGLKMKRAMAWPVFEEKTFRQASGRSIEPREIVIGDVNHDKRPDIVTVVHDRILVYLQDAGDGAKPPAEPIAEKSKASELKAKAAEMIKTRTSGGGSTPKIVDRAGFFKSESVDTANRTISEIKTATGRDVVIETFAELPESDRVKFNRLDRQAQDEFFADWAAKRGREMNVKGVYVVACRRPGKFYVTSIEQGASKATIDRVKQRLGESFGRRQFDQGLAGVLEILREDLKSAGTS
jgi:hypothetical protein